MRYLERRVERPICLARDVFHLLRRLRSRSRMTLAEAVEVAVEDDAGGVGGEAAAHQADEQAVVVGQPWKVVEESAEKAGVGGLDEVADLLQCFAAGESGLSKRITAAAAPLIIVRIALKFSVCIMSSVQLWA